MHIADVESKGINYTLTYDEVEDLLQNPPKILTMIDSTRRMQKLEKCIRSLQQVVKDGKSEVDALKTEIEEQDQQIQDLNAKLAQQVYFAQAFQDILNSQTDEILKSIAPLDQNYKLLKQSIFNEHDTGPLLTAFKQLNLPA